MNITISNITVSTNQKLNRGTFFFFTENVPDNNPFFLLLPSSDRTASIFHFLARRSDLQRENGVAVGKE